MAKRIAAIVGIFFTCSVAWVILGSSITYRTATADLNLTEKVRLLWVGEHKQKAPRASYTVKKTREEEEKTDQGIRKKIVEYEEHVNIPLVRSDIRVKLWYEPRKKGLLWYSTYRVKLAAKYWFKNITEESKLVTVTFKFPSNDAQYDDFQVALVDGKPVSYDHQKGVVTFKSEVAAGEELGFAVSYRSRGLGEWIYQFSPDEHVVTEVSDYKLVMETDFKDIDFPEGSMSPTTKSEKGSGWELVWQYKKLVTGLTIGMLLPTEINPGPLASRITFFAPVSLLFFLFVLFIICVLKKINLHPMHYFFLSLSFFAFHLLFAYLVDHVDVHYTFIIAAATSIILVVSYIRVVVSARFAFIETAALQLLYLVLFSYSHFFEGYTGLIVTIFAILTLFFVMQFTARVKWDEVFKKTA